MSDLLLGTTRRFSVERLVYFLGRAGLLVQLWIDDSLQTTSDPATDAHWKAAGNRMRLALIDWINARACKAEIGPVELANRLGVHRNTASQILQRRYALFRVRRLMELVAKLGGRPSFSVVPGDARDASVPDLVLEGPDASTCLRLHLIDRIVRMIEHEGWSHEEALDRLGISRAGLTKLLARQSSYFTVDRLTLMHARLGVSVVSLLKSAPWPQAFRDS